MYPYGITFRKTQIQWSNLYQTCDKGWLHNIDLKTKSGLSLLPGVHKLDTVDVLDIESSGDVLTRNEVIPRAKLAFYCVVFDRRLLSLIGNLDEDFLNGGEDFDYCYRADKAGWSFVSIHNSFVFHFGGKTRKVSEDENYERHHEEDRYNNSRLNRKLSKSVVAFYLGAGWEKWDEKNLALAGSEGVKLRRFGWHENWLSSGIRSKCSLILIPITKMKAD